MPTDEPEGVDRARARLARIPVRVGPDAQYVESWSNDAWLCDDVVVRVCFHGDRSRLTREAALGAALPVEVHLAIRSYSPRPIHTLPPLLEAPWTWD